MKKLVYFLTIAVLLLINSACSNLSASTNEDVKVMRIANVVSDERSLSQGLYEFKHLVEEKTNGTIKVEVFTNSLLGGDRQIFEGMQLNTIQGATMSTGPISQFAKRFNVLDLPFLFPDEESAYKILDGPIGTELLNDLPEQNVIGLCYWENGFRQLTNNKRKIETLEDVKKLNIRTLENDLHLEIWKKLGARPTPMNYGELYVGLEQGTVDGQENPVGNIVNDKLYEVQDYLTKTNHVYNASPFLVSKPFWDSLTEEEQQIIKEAADQARDYERELNKKESEESYSLLEEQGMIITELSHQEFEKFQRAIEPIYDLYRKTQDEDILNDIISELDEGL